MRNSYSIHVTRSARVAKDHLEARRLYALASVGGFREAPEELSRLEEKNPYRMPTPGLGKRVMVTGTSRGGLKDRVRFARSFDAAKGRCVVQLHGAWGGRVGHDTGDEAERTKNSETELTERD